MPSFQIQDSVAFVTGTNRVRGIGRALVEALIEHGAKKVYATARNTSQLDELVAKYNGKVVAVALDVTDFDAIATLSEKYPDVSLVINNAGVSGGSGDLETAKNEVMAVVDEYSDIKPNALVNINSIASFINFPAGPTYSASKAAAHSLTQAQRRDLPNALVIGVYPGPIDTDMADNIPLDKTPPSRVASEIINALLNGIEEVFPDPWSVQMYAGHKAANA